MKKISKILLGLIITVGLGLQMQAISAENIDNKCGIGFVNMDKIQSGYPYVQTVVKQISQKELELQEYLLDKEKESKNLNTPIQKKNFEEKVAKEFKAKKDAYLKFKEDKENEVYNKIQDATREVLVEQKLEAVVDARVIFVGGIDITDLVLAKLKSSK